jgi:hypothetical protein
VCKLPQEKFDFLGYTFDQLFAEDGSCVPWHGAITERIKRICETISELTGRDQLLLDQEMVVARLNRVLTVWANYFCLGPVSKAYRAMDEHAQKRLRQWQDLMPNQGHGPAGEATTSCIDARHKWARSTSVGSLQQCILCRGSCTLGSHCRRRCLGRKSGETTLGLRPGPCIAVPTVPRHSGALQQRRRRACQEWHEDPNSTEYLRPRLRLGSLGTLRIQNFVTCDK